jgi:hypothetical protein
MQKIRARAIDINIRLKVFTKEQGYWLLSEGLSDFAIEVSGTGD